MSAARRLRLVTLLCLGSLVLASCGATQPSPSPGSTASAAVDASASTAPGASAARSAEPPSFRPLPFDVTPDDLLTNQGSTFFLQPTLAVKGAVSKVIDQAGGRLEAKGPDGTNYRLDIPKEDLIFPTTVTMTPLADVTGLPFDKEPANRVGVQFAPEGLVLVTPATLTITPKAALPAAGVATMDYYGRGTDAGLVLHGQTGTSLTISVEHFSGWLATWPVEMEQWRVLADTQQSRIEDRIREFIAASLGFEQARAEHGLSSLSMLEIIETMSPIVFDRVLQPRLELALSDCTEAKSAAATWLGWVRQLQLIGVSDEDLERLHGKPPTELFDALWTRCLEKEYRRCAATGDLPALMTFLIGFARQTVLSGREVTDEQEAAGMQRLTDCGRFSVRVTTEEVRAGEAAETVRAEREFDLQWMAGGGPFGIFNSKIRAEADIRVLTLSLVGATIDDITTAAPATAEMNVLEFTEPGLLDLKAPADIPPVLSRLDLALGFGQIHFRQTVPHSPPLRLGWFFAHVEEAINGTVDWTRVAATGMGGVVVDHWDSVTDSPFSVQMAKTGKGHDGRYSVDVRLEIVVTHRPR